uniref:Uncharacterized protein n=1 Tax=Ixodes ricinus TaxID=34613 RepID=A0A6B0UYS2_IXORI
MGGRLPPGAAAGGALLAASGGVLRRRGLPLGRGHRCVEPSLFVQPCDWTHAGCQELATYGTARARFGRCKRTALLGCGAQGHEPVPLGTAQRSTVACVDGQPGHPVQTVVQQRQQVLGEKAPAGGKARLRCHQTAQGGAQLLSWSKNALQQRTHWAYTSSKPWLPLS